MKQANKKQKQWMSDVAEWATDNLGSLYGHEWSGAQFHIHHAVGRSAKHNKVAIGHEFILPVPIELHDIGSNHPLNVTHNKKGFTAKFGDQSSIFQIMISVMSHEGYEVPSMEIYHAIMDTRV